MERVLRGGSDMKSVKLIASALGSAAILMRIVLPRMALRALSADNTRLSIQTGPDQPVFIVRHS